MPTKVRKRQGCSLTPLLFNILLKFLDRAIRQKQEIKGIQIGKEEVKLSLFAMDMILYLKEPKNYQKIIRNHKLFWQSSRIQNLFTKNSGFLIYQQLTD
jgi:hypothetical protein